MLRITPGGGVTRGSTQQTNHQQSHHSMLSAPGYSNQQDMLNLMNQSGVEGGTAGVGNMSHHNNAFVVQVMHINQRIKVRLSESETLGAFFHKLLSYFEIHDRQTQNLGLIERTGVNSFVFVRDRQELKYDHLYYLYFRDKPDKTLLYQPPSAHEEEHKKGKILSHDRLPGTNGHSQANKKVSSINMAQGQIEKVKRPKEEKKILICPFEKCLKEFSETGNLKTHMRTHTGERPFVCSICDQQFITKGHLQAHELTHTGEKPFKCPHPGCTKRYSRAGRLKIHQRLHTGERPFICQMEGCEKAFREKGNLLTHMRIHNGQRPFRCDFADCGMSFTTQGHLTDHKRRHSGERPYTCEECQENFMRSSTLKIHMRRHTGERPYVCEKCNKGFSESGNLRTHQRIHGDCDGSSLGKRSRRNGDLSSRFSSAAVTPCSNPQRRAAKQFKKTLGTKSGQRGVLSSSPSNRKRNPMMFDTDRHAINMNELQTPTNVHHCPHKQEVQDEVDDGDQSPVVPRIKVKRLPHPAMDCFQPTSHTFTTKAKSTIIQGFQDQNNPIIEVMPLPKKGRKGTEGSSISQNNSQSLRGNGGETKNTTGGYATNRQGDKDEEIKLPIIKIEQLQPSQTNNNDHHGFVSGGTFTHRHYEQSFSLANFTPLYQNQMGHPQILGLNNLGDTPYSISNQTPQQFLYHQLQNQQVQQQLALSINTQAPQLLTTATQFYYPFSPTGVINYQNHGHNNGQGLTINHNVFSPKGPTTFQAAVQQHLNGNGANGFFMNTPQGVGPGDQSARNHMRGVQSSGNLGIQLINASSSGVAGSACPANFLDDSAQSNNRKGGLLINQIAGATSSFNQQHGNQQQFQMPQNLTSNTQIGEKYSPQPKIFNLEDQQQTTQLPTIGGLRKDFSFAQTVQSLASIGNRQTTAAESPAGRDRGRSFGVQNLTPRGTSANIVPTNNITKISQINQGSGSITNKASNKTASLMAANQKKAQINQDDDPQSFSNLAAKRWQGSSSSQHNNSGQGANNNSQNLSHENSPFVKQKSSTPRGNSLTDLVQNFNNLANAYQKAHQQTLGSTAMFSSENSAFKKSSPKCMLSTSGLQGMNSQLKGIAFSGNNTPRVYGSTNASSDKLIGASLLSLHNGKRSTANGSGLSLNQAGPPAISGNTSQNAPYFGGSTTNGTSQIMNFSTAAQALQNGTQLKLGGQMSQGNLIGFKNMISESPRQKFPLELISRQTRFVGVAGASPSNVDHQNTAASAAGEFSSPKPTLIQMNGNNNLNPNYGFQSFSTFSQKVHQQQPNQQKQHQQQ